MRQRSDTWKRLAARGNFRMESIAIINGVEYTAISAPIINRALFTDNLSVGNCISSTLKVSVLTDDVLGKAAEVVIKARITDDEEYSEWLEFGTFYIDNRSVDSGLITMQCYDAMLKASQTYGDETNPEDRIGWPKTMKTCVNEIAARIGVEIDPRTVIKTTDPYQVPYPNKMSMMQVLGYIGACHGGNWVITPENKLRLVPLLSPPAETFNIIDHDYNPIYTGDGHKLVWQHTDTGDTIEHKAGGGLVNVPVVVGKIATSKHFTVTRVIIARDEDLGYALGDDSGYTLIIESNPYACQAICDDLYAELNGMEYNPYTITSACYDPATELGDWILVGDQVRSVLYSENATLNVDYRATLSAPGKDEVGSEYPYLTSIQRLQMEQEQIKKYTETEKDEIYSKIEQTHTDILLQVAGTFATKEAVTTAITLTAETLITEVSKTYATKESVETLSSSVTQTAQQIELKVSKGDISSQISIETGQVSIGSNRLVIDSTNFKLDGSGEVTAKGTITSESGSYKNSIHGGGMYLYADDNEVGYIRGISDFNTSGWGTSGKGLAISSSMPALILATGSDIDWDTSGYILNNGLNPNGFEERNILVGNTRIWGDSDLIVSRIVFWDSPLSSPTFELMYDWNDDFNISSTTYVGFSGCLMVYEDFCCFGEKNRLVTTENYGTVKLNAMESAAALFADFGSGTTDDAGLCYVYFDSRFWEVFDHDYEYQVFITKTRDGDGLFVEKRTDHFIVYGGPNMSFDWSVYVRQKDYAQNYLEQMPNIKAKEKESEEFYGDNIGADASAAYMAEFVDTYDEQAEAYLNNYDLEVTNYGN